MFNDLGELIFGQTGGNRMHISESCCCGAKMEADGDWSSVAFRQKAFQIQHEICRKPKTAEAKGSALPPGSDTMPGLNEAETDEYRYYLTCHIGEITQEDWQRFHELNARYIDALGR